MRISKMALALLLCCCMLTASLAPASAKGNYLTGDVNNSGKIDATDALLALQHSVRINVLTGDALEAADTNGDGAVNANDALLILQYSVELITMFPADMTGEERYYASRDAYYHATGEDFVDNGEANLEDIKALLEQYGQDPEAADLENCGFTVDGRLVYTPVSNAAQKLGTLNKYDNAEKVSGSIELNGAVLNYTMPKKVTAYDAVPIQYTLTSYFPVTPLHISATTYEEPDRYQDAAGNYFDCNLPGNVDFEFTYNGYVAGNIQDGYAPSWQCDFNDTQGTNYPAYETSELIKSGTISSQDDVVWFNFGFKNTGNTILDSEGNGAFNFCPALFKKNRDGVYEQTINPSTDNYMQRIYDYLYPGEEGDLWLLFIQQHTDISNNRYRLTPGDYRIVIYTQVRNEREANGWAANYVGGRSVGEATFEFTVTTEGAITAPNPVQYVNYGNITRNQWIGAYEEFQSSYQSTTMISADEQSPTSGVIYVQPAPWNTTVSLKIMHQNYPEIATAHIPIEVESDSISVELNPYNENYHVKEDGTREPLLVTQSMIDMRGNVQMGPDALSTGINDLRNMKEAGINLLTSTMAFAYDNNANDSYKFMMDVARVMGFEMEAFSNYPYNATSSTNNARNINGGAINGTYNGWGSKDMNEANGILAKYTLQRYGDLLWMRGDGVLPIAAEDTWGWLTIDHDWRFGLANTRSILQYREWLQTVYPDIASLNAAYGSNYTSFDEIDPREDGTYEETHYGAYNFTNSTGVYQERSRAVAELDVYRTLARIHDYETMLETADVDNARLWIRYEGSTWLAAGISPSTTNAHYRQFYYEQRRNAVIPEILSASNVVFGGSNYDGVPLTPTETYEMTKYSTLAGLTMSKLPMIAHMRDTLINPYYGNSKYVVDYNLTDTTQKGACIDTTTALFPYLKAMYEGGGIPGVMWQDYYCDGFITSTQYKELKFYTQKIQEMLSTEAGKEWATNFETSERTFEKDVKEIWSYPREYIEKVVAETPRDCHFDYPYVK